MIEKAAALSGQVTLIHRSRPVPLVVRECSKSEALDEGLAWQPPLRLDLTPEHILIFDAVVPCDLDAVADEVKDLDLDPLEAAQVMLVGDLEKLAGDLVLAASIAEPGALEPTEILCRVEGETESRLNLKPTHIYPARREAEEKGWPQLESLRLDTCLEWLRRIPGFLEGVPYGALGRAVSAASKLLGFDAPAPGEGLMWCMIGLEALYTSGHEGLSAQLLEKAQVLLGQLQAHKKAFKGLYPYRSRFIHGDLDFPLAYTPYDALEAFMKSEMHLYDIELLSTAFLIGSLQSMASAGRMDLRFHWALD
jgi:hypothetical protein